MIRITNLEAKKMKEMGVPCGEEGICRTLGGTYYLTESKKNLQKLKKYRDSITLCSVCGK